MYDKKTRNKNLLKKLIDMVLVIIFVTIANIISVKCFDGSFGMQILLIVIFMAIAVPIDLWIEKKIDSKDDQK